jgi:hypothetical protein
MLAQLAVVFYRPDFSEGQAKQLIGIMVEDLISYPLPEIDQALKIYRRDPDAKYFPRSGQIIEIILAGRRERAQSDKIGPRIVPVSRPLMWWHRPKSRWNVGWIEADVPAGELVRDTEGSPLRAARG